MKHAFLIIAHNEPDLLLKLLDLLNCKDFDVFVHVDKKSSSVYDAITEKAKSNVSIFSEFSVTWGHSSQVECTLFMLERAGVDNYDYFHLLSGVDLPTKNNTEIKEIFERNNGKEFVHFDNVMAKGIHKQRVEYRHYLSSFYKFTNNKILNKIIFIADDALVGLQKMLNIKKSLPYKQLQKGCNWFSITRDLALYLLMERNNIKKLVKYSRCADEVFLQTVVFNSVFRENLYCEKFADNHDACLRYILWEKGAKSPKSISINDLDQIRKSPTIFARKFNYSKNPQLVNEYINNLNEK